MYHYMTVKHLKRDLTRLQKSYRVILITRHETTLNYFQSEITEHYSQLSFKEWDGIALDKPPRQDFYPEQIKALENEEIILVGNIPLHFLHNLPIEFRVYYHIFFLDRERGVEPSGDDFTDRAHVLEFSRTLEYTNWTLTR